MSRWLSQVTTFLEQMDDQAEEMVEENINRGVGGGPADPTEDLDSILAQRGLNVTVSHDDDDDDNDNDDVMVDDGLDDMVAAIDQEAEPAVPQSQRRAATTADGSMAITADPTVSETTTTTVEPPVTNPDRDPEPPKVVEETTTATDTPVTDVKSSEGTTSSKRSNQLEHVKDKTPQPQEASITKGKEELTVASKEKEEPAGGLEVEKALTKEAPVKVSPAPPPPPPPPKSAPSAPPPPPTTVVTKDPNPALVKEAREAQKEVRTLRRHVVALNKQLETVEEEVSAQRKELEQTGGIMEKERAKAKAERDKERKKHAEERKATQEQHEKALLDQKTRMEQQMAELKQRLHDMENTRKQEGGTWDKELQGSVEREQILAQKNAALEDEKETFLAQIGILQSQQEALGDRIESLSQTADSAMEREREAEERLDQALSVHAHQISQRQSRERELERQLAEMGSAMASLRSKETSRLSSEYSKKASEASESAGENTSQDSSLRVRLEMALHDLETSQANLDLERQRTEALQREVKDISSERTEEAANARMKQNKHDRQVAELTLQLSRMQQQTTVETDASSKEPKNLSKSAEVHELRNQVKELSEEILKTREKFGGSSSEIATLKSRLKAANDRAEKAERDLEDALATENADRMERALPHGGSSMRRRGVGKAPRSGAPTISGAMHLPKDQKIVKGVDAVDSFSMSAGKYLRSNPFARAAFLTYLMILHVYVFVILIYHAHNFEDIHRDVADLPHGPDALMQKQLGAGGQAIAAAVTAAKEAAKNKTP